MEGRKGPEISPAGLGTLWDKWEGTPNVLHSALLAPTGFAPRGLGLSWVVGSQYCKLFQKLLPPVYPIPPTIQHLKFQQLRPHGDLLLRTGPSCLSP